MQFCLFNIRPKFIALTGSYENYASHCSELSQLHQQPVDAALHQTFLETVINCQALKPLHSHRMLIKILSSLLNGAMWAGSVTLNFHNSRYFRCPVWKTKSWLKSKPTRKREAYKLYSRVFWIFLPNVIKIDLYNFELYRFKVGAFFSETVYRLSNWLGKRVSPMKRSTIVCSAASLMAIRWASLCSDRQFSPATFHSMFSNTIL